ncbi:uncharacterized protein I303_107463 [Kwoniella dejecticola CBS 10117]|uniref:Uncharacterized protein n=1 Tax=Kwoniella dejecticola CBS 10117 TaxID=1296121 RepID=A0A1A5ZZS2_9TREE|nr:uncharacterized protein I303_06869 [Kwoniella dejecticola CBS 10117]OBR83304.1 hypothetical protein I303_06869 [Kwoniella dejecticola CBS 10117]
MSTTAIRMTTHAPSPSYVPRSTLGSRPSSPALPPKPQTASSSYPNHARSSSTSRLDSSLKASTMSPSLGGAGSAPTPRLGNMERSSSGLRSEVKKDVPRSEAAQAILNILSSLPAPLPEILPPTFLPTPSASPVSSSATSAGSPTRTFGDYARSSLKRNKRKRSTDSSSASSSSSSDEPSSGSGGIGIGLGLGLSMSSPEQPRKKPRTESSKPDLIRRSSAMSQTQSGGRSLTPAGLGQPSSSPALTSKKLGGSALRNEVTEEEGKETWSKDKWRSTAAMYRDRALLLKRHGDAYQRVPSAHPKYTSRLPKDPLKGLLSLTDAVLLWLYAYFCDEQHMGRVRITPYNESAPLREFVKKAWESEMRKAPEEEEGRREMAQAMVGLMHLIEAVIGYHLTAEHLAHLNKRGRELQASSSSSANPHHHSNNNGVSPHSQSSTRNSASPPNTNIPAGPPSSQSHSHSNSHSHPQPSPSPAARSHSSSGHSPESAHTSGSGSYSFPPDLLPLINTSTSSSSKAQQHLLTSRHHLSLRLLRTFFPRTFEYAITSELNDEALPAPGDNLGSARKVDIDNHPERFAWPIELGMCAPVAHTVAFGRCLVEEMAEHLGKDWVRVLE